MSLNLNFIPLSDNTELYKILELKPQEEDQQIIKKNYNKLLKINHPDKGGSQEKMQRIVKALEILLNPGLKYLYDKFGKVVFDVVNPEAKYLSLIYFKWAFDCLNANKEFLRGLHKRIIEEHTKIKKLEKEFNVRKFENEKALKKEIQKDINEIVFLDSENLILNDLNKLEKEIEELKNNLSELIKQEKLHQEKDDKMIRNLYQIKLHVEEKIRKKFKELYLDSLDNLKNYEISAEITTNQLDYLNAILKNPQILSFKSFRKLRNDNLFDEENMFFITSIDFYKKNTIAISLDSELKLNKKTKFFSQDYSINIDKIFQFPYAIKIFDNDFIATNNSIQYDIHDTEITLTHGLKLPNFLFMENLLFRFNTSFSYNFVEKKLSFNHNKIGLNYKFHNKLTTIASYDIHSNNFETHVSKKIDKSNQLTLYLNVGKSKTIFGFQKNYHAAKPKQPLKSSEESDESVNEDFTGRHSNQNSIYLHDKGFILSNQNIINFKIFGFDFDTSINVIKKNSLKFNTTFSIGFRIHKLNFKVPIKIAKTKNYFVFALAFLSNWFGPLMYNLYLRNKKYQRKAGKYYLAVAEVIKEKYESFLSNKDNFEKYERIVAREKEINGLIVNYAFIGSLIDIEVLNYEIKLLGVSNQQIFQSKIFSERKIYGIKMALSMRIVDSKISIKNDLFDTEGIYNPALHKYENIGVIICYTYRFHTFYEFVKNVEKIKIPLVD